MRSATHRSPWRLLTGLLLLLAVACNEPQPADPQVDDGNNDINNDINNMPNNDPNNDQPNNDAPDAGEPDADEPDVDEPDADEPDADEPDADEPDADDTPDADEPDVPPADCESFALEADEHYSLPLRTARIAATGGSGQYRWSTPPGNQADSSVNVDTGVFLAGQAEGVTERVDVTDVVCDRTLSAQVHVVRRATIEPAQPIIPVGGLVCFSLTGGSGDQFAPDSPFDWALVQGIEGSSVGPDGCYSAGLVPGLDVLQVTDRRTGQIIQVGITVTDDDVSLRTSAPLLLIAPGESYEISATGGSGLFIFDLRPPVTTGTRLEETGDPHTIRVVAGDTPGVDTLLVRDAFLGDVERVVPIHVMGEGRHEPTPYGNHSDEYDLKGVGDVNGDGFGDVVLSMRNGSFNGLGSGVAYLFLGGQATEQGVGLGATPAQIIPGTRRNQSLGRAIAAGDFNGDGCQDVAVGIYAENLTGSQRGEVRVLTGCHEDPLEQPVVADWNGRLNDNLPLAGQDGPLRFWQRLSGIANNDRFGWGVASGDFDGDGRDDLIVSAYQAETNARVDPDDDEPYVNIGRLYVFLQRENGTLVDLPDLFIDGLFIDEEGDLASADQLQMGQRMATADVNGDGCDDVLVGADLGDGQHGLASLYLSVQSNQRPSGCILGTTPAVTVVPSPEDRRRTSRMGRAVSFGDFNGDCVPDLVVAQFLAPRLGGGNTAAGAVNIFFGDPSWSGAAPVRLLKTDADVIVEGDDNDQFGSDVAVGDIDGDGDDDLVVGVRLGEDPGAAPDVGQVWLYMGQNDPRGCQGPADPEAPALSAPVVVNNHAERNGDFMGQSVAVVGDVDGDEIGDWVALVARGQSQLGGPEDHQGRLVWHAGGAQEIGTDTLRVSDYPMPLADDLFGFRTEAVGDLNGDGLADFLVTAPLWDLTLDRNTYLLPQGSSGAAYLHLGRPEGLSPQPDAVFSGHPSHSASDQFGYSATFAGDFDGDGATDVAIAAPFDDNNSNCTPCRAGAGFIGDIGVVNVYRGRPGLVSARAPGEPLVQLSEPDFIICGPQEANVRVGREVAGGFDLNGDGFDDLVMSNWNVQNQRGRVWYAMGRAAGGPRQVICMADRDEELGRGDNNGDFVGHGVGGLDLDGDGCDDALASGYNDDAPGRANAGIVHAWLGWGPSCLHQAPVHVEMIGERANDNVGFRLALPGDVDGDGVADLAVASSGLGIGNEGAVVIFNGARLRELLADVREDASFILGADTVIGRMIEPEGLAGTQFGYGLAALGDIDGDGRGDLVVGSRFSSASGVLRSGAGYIYLGSDDPEDLARPDGVIAGSVGKADAEFGASVAGGRLGAGGRSVVLIGAPFTDWDGPELGELGSFFMTTLDLDQR